MKARVKALIANNQLEFVNGGWVANDEATPYYEDIMENFKIGNRWLYQEFGIIPTIGWQVDSFGTSATHAILLAQTGYEAIFFSRLDYLDRNYRRGNQTLEFIWKPPSPNNESIFTHILSHEYEEIKYLARGARSPQVFKQGLSDKDLQAMENYLQKEKSFFKSDEILFQFCGDFYNPSADYPKMDAMNSHFNQKEKQEFEFKFSSLSNMVTQAKSKLDMKSLPVKHGDFFPYIDFGYHTWSGYFTSKAVFKRLVRATGEYFQAMKILAAKVIYFQLTNPESFGEISSKLNYLHQVLSILQHHDAITGTMKEFVKNDYEKMVSKAVKELDDVLVPHIKRHIQSISSEKFSSNLIELQFENKFRRSAGEMSLKSLLPQAILKLQDSGLYL